MSAIPLDRFAAGPALGVYALEYAQISKCQTLPTTTQPLTRENDVHDWVAVGAWRMELKADAQVRLLPTHDSAEQRS